VHSRRIDPIRHTAHALVVEQGCAGSTCSAGCWHDSAEADSRRASSAIFPGLIYGRDSWEKWEDPSHGPVPGVLERPVSRSPDGSAYGCVGSVAAGAPLQGDDRFSPSSARKQPVRFPAPILAVPGQAAAPETCRSFRLMEACSHRWCWRARRLRRSPSSIFSSDPRRAAKVASQIAPCWQITTRAAAERPPGIEGIRAMTAAEFFRRAKVFVLPAGCATEVQQIRSQEDLLAVDGFKAVPANTPARQQQMAQLPPDHRCNGLRATSSCISTRIRPFATASTLATRPPTAAIVARCWRSGSREKTGAGRRDL
jgi:hypothetical protein